MTSKCVSLLTIALVLALPIAVRAQDSTADDRPAATQMYENVEIMCRLLDDKIRTDYQPLQAARLVARGECAACHALPGTMGSLLSPQNQPQTSIFDSFAMNPLKMGSTMNIPHDRVHQMGLVSGAEGVYLKGQGVVFTITLPPSDQNPTSASSVSEKTPTSDWERMRKKLHQEPVEGETSSTSRNPSLSESLLRLIAENGKHFSQLGEKESLTVVVTFRSLEAPTWTKELVKAPLMLGQRQSGTGQALPGQNGGPSAPAPTPGYLETPKNSADEYRLLGDLHSKQGKTNEALSAYRKALAFGSGDARESAALLIKIAEFLKMQNKDKEAVETLQKAIALLKGTGEKGSKAPTESGPAPLPSKLIVSVPKSLLDRAAAGKISSQEFAKAASVELLSFTNPKKQ